MALEFPANPTLDQSFTASNNIIYIWGGSEWTSIGANTVSTASVSVGASAPTVPVIGNLWYNTTTAKLTVWYNNQWTDVRPAS